MDSSCLRYKVSAKSIVLPHANQDKVINFKLKKSLCWDLFCIIQHLVPIKENLFGKWFSL